MKVATPTNPKLLPRCFSRVSDECPLFLSEDEIHDSGERKDGTSWYICRPCREAWIAEQHRKDVLEYATRQARKRRKRKPRVPRSTPHSKLVDARIPNSELPTCPDCGYAGGRHSRICQL